MYGFIQTTFVGKEGDKVFCSTTLMDIKGIDNTPGRNEQFSVVPIDVVSSKLHCMIQLTGCSSVVALLQTYTFTVQLMLTTH